jgi:lysophospholipase L1-like esterase
MTERKARRSLLKKLLAAVLVPLVFFGILEGILRVAGFRYDPNEAYESVRFPQELVTGDIYARHPEFLWTLKPSTALDFPGSGIVVHSNELGLRGDLPSRERAPGEARILCLGDSVTFGLGLREGDTWPDRLEKALRKNPPPGVAKARVLNGAVPGWSSVQGLRFLDRYRWWEPDVVIFWFGLNDAKEAPVASDSGITLPDPDVARVVQHLRRLRTFQLVQAALSGIKRSGDGRRVSVEEFRGAVKRLVEESRAGGPFPVFVRAPERMSLTIRQLEAVLARAEATGAVTLAGPRKLFSPSCPAWEGVDLVGRFVPTEEEPALVFDRPNADAMSDPPTVRSDLSRLKAQKERLDLLLAELPETALGYEELFGDRPHYEVFHDNCHLSPPGAALAGEALARRVRKILAGRAR